MSLELDTNEIMKIISKELEETLSLKETLLVKDHIKTLVDAFKAGIFENRNKVDFQPVDYSQMEVRVLAAMLQEVEKKDSVPVFLPGKEYELFIDVKSIKAIDHVQMNIHIPQDVCECGSEKANQPGHSHWCPKAEPEL